MSILGNVILSVGLIGLILIIDCFTHFDRSWRLKLNSRIDESVLQDKIGKLYAAIGVICVMICGTYFRLGGV